jgi:hypothetical protein
MANDCLSNGAKIIRRLDPCVTIIQTVSFPSADNVSAKYIIAENPICIFTLADGAVAGVDQICLL